MNTRRTMALLASDISNDYMNRICAGASKQANALGYDLIILTMAFNIGNNTEIQFGEENIFTLLNNESVDGVILLLGNALNSGLLSKISDTVKKMGIPMVSVESEVSGEKCIYPDDSVLFEQMTDHFIEQHRCRNVMCLTGIEGVEISESRLKGYKRSLAKHGIKIKEENIIYGDFWKMSASKLAEELVSATREMPDAIVCANDSMAVTLCNSLINNGVRVPEDVMISGYDCSRYATENVPSITTIFPDNDLLGAKAAVSLHHLITGDNAELLRFTGGSLLFLGSCGCNKGLDYVVRKRTNYAQFVKQYETYYNNSGMIESLSKARTLEHLLRKITHFIYLLVDLDIFMLCVDKNWADFENPDEDAYLRKGYPEKLDVQMFYRFGEYDFGTYEFESKEIIPSFSREYNPEPSTYFLMPLHFMDRCFGYSVFKFKDADITVSHIFSSWNRDISLALEFLRVRTRFTAINQRLSLSSLRDTLTGVYNRQGFKRYSEKIFKRVKKENKKLFVLMADLDMLKHINDNFGHIEGDNAITVCANGLNTCCKNNEICARIGGDEYAIVGCYDYTEEIINGYIDYINEYFERYNKSSEKNYKVGASLGYYCGNVEEDKDFQYYLEIADKRMYENKFLRKKYRTD